MCKMGPVRGGWVKLNTDGARKSDTDLASVRGLVKDSEGNWITGFMTNRVRARKMMLGGPNS